MIQMFRIKLGELFMEVRRVTVQHQLRILSEFQEINSQKLKIAEFLGLILEEWLMQVMLLNPRIKEEVLKK